jgi:hypothetical protein
MLAAQKPKADAGTLSLAIYLAAHGFAFLLPLPISGKELEKRT